jgi:putative DNA-invertase from lambdoid prophage Rac
MQLINLRDYISSRGWESAGEYVDTGWSGAKTSRPQLDRLMRDARLRRFDSVLVWKLDRWGRSLADCVRSIQELAALGIRFVAMTQNIDTDESNPASRLLLHIFAAFGEFERELIRERVVTGIRAAQGRGKRLGRPRRVFRRDQALLLRAEGKSWREIAQALGVPFSTVIDAWRAE